jgi:hypothetical protein
LAALPPSPKTSLNTDGCLLGLSAPRRDGSMTGGFEGLIEAVQERQRILREVDSVGEAQGRVTRRNLASVGAEVHLFDCAPILVASGVHAATDPAPPFPPEAWLWMGGSDLLPIA